MEIDRYRVWKVCFMRFLMFFLPFAAVGVISIFYTWNRFYTINNLNVLSWVVGVVFLFSISEKRETLLKALLAGAVLSVFCMIAQTYLLFPNLFKSSLTGSDAIALSERVVPFSSFINESPLGGFFVTLLPIALYFALLKKNILSVMASLLIFFGLLFSMSRIAIIISFIYFVVLAFLIAKKKLNLSIKSVKSTGKNKRKILTLFFVTILTYVLLILPLYGAWGEGKQNKSLHRIHERIVNRIKNFPEHLSTLDGRMSLWDAGIDAFSLKPLVGYGPGAYDNAYRKFYSGGLYSQHAHSSILEIIVETGVIGLLSFLFYLYSVTLGLRKLLVNNGIYTFFAISFVSSFIFSILNISFEVPSYLIIFFIFTSVFITDVEKEKLKSANKPVSYIVFCFIIILLASSFFFTSRAGLADKSIQRVIVNSCV